MPAKSFEGLCSYFMLVYKISYKRFCLLWKARFSTTLLFKHDNF